MKVTNIKPYQKAVLCEMVDETTKTVGRVLLSTAKDSVNYIKYRVLDTGKAMSAEEAEEFKPGTTFLAIREDSNTISININDGTQYIVYLRDVIAIVK